MWWRRHEVIGGAVLALLAIVIISTAPSVNPAYGTDLVCAREASPPTVTARAAYAEDLSNKDVLVDKNASAQLPLASLTKVMTALTAWDTLKPDDIVAVNAAALAPEGDSGLTAGERWSVADLTAYTLITSSNDGAHALALAASATRAEIPEAFITAMNTKAGNLGLESTYFLNDTGLDLSTTTAGAYGSARDMAHLIAYAAEVHPAIIEASGGGARVIVSDSGLVHSALPTSALSGTVPGEVALKTGTTDLAGGNLVTVIEVIPGHPVAIAVLGADESTRADDVLALATFAKREIKRGILCTTKGL